MAIKTTPSSCVCLLVLTLTVSADGENTDTLTPLQFSSFKDVELNSDIVTIGRSTSASASSALHMFALNNGDSNN